MAWGREKEEIFSLHLKSQKLSKWGKKRGSGESVSDNNDNLKQSLCCKL